MELLIMVYACKTSCAKSIIGVIPYFPYSKQCKMRKRGSIVSKLLASMMCKAGKTCGSWTAMGLELLFLLWKLQTIILTKLKFHNKNSDTAFKNKSLHNIPREICARNLRSASNCG